ncbi:LOW QUALITY PROTEIN: 3-oxo-5-alpha-steroid 4-dehydrogenase 1-like [Corticium candelabrum]|uniref:LOW QUALITY PROTEIN: 3-oxo-5-alpha-steroid 4-dehydrogenase 1-like n=1 Tax=Corticium candelabrum TaxID=121492 RepID=UPI002E31F46E|nr:LOW QUALITY PROTEIN: 3-oxo-5-alpha-steroid 4-dehydrogenase 1-like [Corticium candelabrum]
MDLFIQRQLMDILLAASVSVLFISIQYAVFWLYSSRSLIYPWLIRSDSPITCITFSFGIVINVVSGYLYGRYLTEFATYSEEWLYHPCFISGIVLFFIGMAVNIHADLLRTLRNPGETGYKIPRGGLFEYISAANFFAKIIEWIGYGVASWFLVGLILPLLTVCNLLPRGLHHHRYYHNKFEDYPKDRKAVIPFTL